MSSLSLLLVNIWTLLVPLCVEQDSTSLKPKIPPAPIAMEAFTLKPGEPLSARALVTKPPVLKEARGWTLETVRHRGILYTMSYSPDGQFLATGGMDGMIRIWNVTSQTLHKVLVGHSGTVYLLEWSPDGQHLAAVGDSYFVTLWDTVSGHPLRKLRHKFVLNAIAWSHDGTRLAGAGGHSGVTIIWDATRGLEKHVIEVGQAVGNLAWSPDGNGLAIQSEPLGVQIYDPTAGKLTRVLGPPATPSSRASWSPDSKRIAAIGRDSLMIWDAVTGDMLHTIKGVFHLLEWSPDGKRVAAGYLNAHVTLFDPDKGAELSKLPAAAKRLTWSPDGKTLTTSDDGTVVFWDAAAATRRATMQVASNTFLYWSPAHARAFEPRGSTIWVWDTATCQVLHKLEHSPGLYTWALSRDGKTLACSVTNQSLVFWDLTKGEKVRTVEKVGVVGSLTWSPDDSLLAGVLNSSTIGIWRTATGEKLHTLDGHKKAVSTISWASQGKTLASGGADETVREWNAETGKLTATFPMPKAKTTHNYVYSVSWGGGMLAVYLHEAGFRLLQASTGKPIQTKKPIGGTRALAWAPGATLLAGASSGTAYIWNAKTGDLAHQLTAWGNIGSLAWSPAASTLTTSCTDSTVRAWDATAGRLRGVLTVGDAQLLAVSAEGHCRLTPSVEAEYRYVVQLGRGQQTLTPEEFATKYRWKNVPANVRLNTK